MLIRCEEKILDRETLTRTVADLKLRGRKVVLVIGAFDLLHVGHLRFLEAARALGDSLVIAIYDGSGSSANRGPSGPLLPSTQSRRVVAGLESVDYVTEFPEDNAAEFIQGLKPDILARTDGGAPADDAISLLIHEWQGEVRTIPTEPGHSTRETLDRVRAAGPQK